MHIFSKVLSFMQNSFHQKLQTFAVFLILGNIGFFGNYGFADELKKSSKSDQSNNELIPMPVGDLKSALTKVNSQRNPFQNPSKSEITNIDDLYLTLKFKGLAKSGNKLLAIIESEDIQKFYAVGDSLNNGFLVKSISFEEISVDISNGSKNYRLILNNLNKSL